MTESGSRAADRQSLKLIDLMLVVAAAAFVIWESKWAWDHPIRQYLTNLPSAMSGLSSIQISVNIPAMAIELTGTIALAASLTLVGIRLRRPRPRWPLLMRQPGWIACSEASIASVGAVAMEWTGHSIRRSNQIMHGTFAISDHLSSTREGSWFATVSLVGGLAVLISWLNLCLRRRWRGEQSWIDRGGRVVGVVWLVLLVGFLGINSYL